jgi:hypothetical protein
VLLVSFVIVFYKTSAVRRFCVPLNIGQKKIYIDVTMKQENVIWVDDAGCGDSDGKRCGSRKQRRYTMSNKHSRDVHERGIMGGTVDTLSCPRLKGSCSRGNF